MTEPTAPEYDPSDPLFEGRTLSLGPAVVPLLEQAQEHKGEKVIVYIAGGIRVDGKLRDVDEEALVLTIDDSTHRQYVAIESVAVLAVER